MSDLGTVQRRKDKLEQMKQQIDSELARLEIAEQVLLGLDEGEEEDADSGSAKVSMNLTNDLDGKSASEAAKFVLSRADARREGLHYQKILDLAVRLGYRRGEDDPGR